MNPAVRLLLPILLWTMFNPACAGSSHSSLRVGDSPEAVVLKDAQGHALTLPDDLKGKVALVRFWANDCHYCHKELLAGLEALYLKYKSRGFEPVAIDVGRPGRGEGRKPACESCTYPMFDDPVGLAGKRFQIMVLPTTFILDEKGVVREKIVGDVDIETLEKLITQVLYKAGFYDGTY